MVKRINEFLDNNIVKIVIIFLCMQPMLNLVTSLMIRLCGIDFTVGMFVRSIFLLIFGYYSLLVLRHNKYKNLFFIYLIVICIYVFIYIFNIFIYKDISVLLTEVKYLIKTFYFPIMLLFLSSVFEQKKLNIKFSYLIIPIYLYIITMVIANITNTGFVSYSGGKLGNVGWFYAANEIGSIIAIMFPILILWVIEKENKISFYILLIIYIVTALQMGTKVPFLGILLSLSAMGIFYFIKYIVTRERKNIYMLIIPIIITSVFIIFILPYTPVGKNLNMHFKLVNVEGLKDFLFINHENNEHEVNKDPLNVIYSSRDKFLSETKKTYFRATSWQKATGLGLIENFGTNNQRKKSIEMDFHDIFYRFGYLGFILYLMPLLFWVVSIIKSILIDIKKTLMNTKVVCYSIALALGLAIAFIAGHVLTAPAVSVYLVYIMLILKGELDLKVGGIHNEENMD